MTDMPPGTGQAPRDPPPAPPGPYTGFGPPGGIGQPAGFGPPGWFGQPGYPVQDYPGYPAPPGYPMPGHPRGGGHATPAPGSIPLRPLGVGDILSGAFTLIRQNPAATLGLTGAAITALVATMAVILLIASQTTAAMALLAVPVGLALFGVQVGGLTAAMGRGALGCDITIVEAVRLSRAGWVILAMLSLAAMFAAPWIVLIVALRGWGVLIALLLTAWLAVLVSLTIPVLVLERRGPLRALGRSWRLVFGSYWRTLGIYVLAYLITTVLSLIISFPIEIASGLTSSVGISGSSGATVSVALGIFVIGEIVTASLTATIQTGVLVLVYADLRMRKEGLDLVLQQAAQDAPLDGDEFAASRPGGAYTGGAVTGAGLTRAAYTHGYGDGATGDYPPGPPAV